MKDIEDVKKALGSKRKSQVLRAKDFVSTGSTLLNLAVSDRVNGGFAKGRYYFFVGDSSSGKTFFTLTSLAEATINSNFDDYRLIYDATTEDGALMDFERYFGAKMAERTEILRNQNIEEFYYTMDDIHKAGRPFIYVLDSMDGLGGGKDEDKKFKQQKLDYRKGRESAGSFGDGKAKKNSGNLRRVVGRLMQNGSILIVICQTRDDISPSFGPPIPGGKKTRAGGRALKFYSQLEMWSSVRQKVKRNIREKNRQIGILARVDVKKNRFTGKERAVDIIIHHSHGIDDVGSCVEYLISEGHWKKLSETKVKAPEFDFSGSKEKLVRMIEEENQEKELRSIVGEVWEDIEDACKVERKSRYA